MLKQTRKVTASFSQDQFNDLQALMKEDGQTNLTFYLAYLISQEKKTRNKRPVGRPRKEESGTVEELWYPAPYDANAPPYTMDDLTAYYTYRGEAVPPQPAPFTKEQLEKWGQ